MLLRSQQRELTELRGQIEAMQSSIMAQVEHVLTNHQEQERILLSSVPDFKSLCIFQVCFADLPISGDIPLVGQSPAEVSLLCTYWS